MRSIANSLRRACNITSQINRSVRRHYMKSECAQPVLFTRMFWSFFPTSEDNLLGFRQRTVVSGAIGGKWDPNEIEKLTMDRDFSHEDKRDLESLVGYPPEQMARKVLIYKPAKQATSSGLQIYKEWRLRFFPGAHWKSALMGWTSSNDPVENVHLNFKTKERAIEFAKTNGFDVVVDDNEHNLRKNERTYGDRFRHIPVHKHAEDADLE